MKEKIRKIFKAVLITLGLLIVMACIVSLVMYISIKIFGVLGVLVPLLLLIFGLFVSTVYRNMEGE